MRKSVKFVAAIMAMVAAFSMVGCNVGGGDIGIGVDEKVDKTRTQLYVSNFNGGYGEEWLNQAKKRFEEKYAETSFEEGKKGVQILKDNAKSGGTTIISTIDKSRNQVFFTEGVYYQDFVTQGKVLDITDMVTEKLTEYGETRSIEDKLTPEQKQFLNYEGKYYMIPHYEGYNGITIDVDLFDQYSLFMGSDGKFQYKSTSTGKLSNGPDNIAGTYDDGLPATYEDFYGLCRAISKRGISPISWSGEFQFYVRNLVSAMAADCNGYDGTVLTFSFNGSANNLVKSVTDGVPELESATITSNNGYETFRQEGYYYSLNFLNELIKNKWYSTNSFTGAFSHLDTQDAYLLGSYESSMQTIAMLVEGCWWESEATETFNSMQGAYKGSGKMERRFRFIPFPKATADKVGEGQTLLENNSAYGFINANIEEKYKDLAIKFLQFCNTDESLCEFTMITNTPKGLQYTMTEEQVNKCSYYGKSIMDIKNAENTKVVYPVSNNPLYYFNQSTLSSTNRLMTDKYTFPSTAIKDELVADGTDYFNQLGAYWKKNWTVKFSKYLED